MRKFHSSPIASIGASLIVLGVAWGLAPTARAAPPAVAQLEITYLLGLIEQSGCAFFRNGTWYDAQQAQAHLRAKYDALNASDQIRTAEDFIEKAASNSSMSGRPYQIRCMGSVPMPTSQWFSKALAHYREFQ